jgi:hypothetical protein
MVTLRPSVIVVAVAVLLFALSSGDLLSEPLAMAGVVIAAILAGVGVLLFCVWLSHRRDTRDA